VTQVDLTGRAAVVTGAGVDLAYAGALAAAGAAVVVHDADEAAAVRATERIAAAGRRAVAEPGAVGPATVARRLVDRAVGECWRLDLLVTNAAVLRMREHGEGGWVIAVAAAEVTGQAIGIGGDKLSLWVHPDAVAYRDSGCTADAIAETWRSSVGRAPQLVGIPGPKEQITSGAAA